MRIEAIGGIDLKVLSDLVNARLGKGTHAKRMEAYRRLPPGEEGNQVLHFANQLAKAIAERQEPQGSRVAR